jgi:hypothetical protein
MDAFEQLAREQLSEHPPGRSRHRAFWSLVDTAAQRGPALPRIFDALPVEVRAKLFLSVAQALLPDEDGESRVASTAMVVRALFWEAVGSGRAGPEVEEASWRALGPGEHPDFQRCDIALPESRLRG